VRARELAIFALVHLAVHPAEHYEVMGEVWGMSGRRQRKSARRKYTQLELPFRARGGRRPGAGRKPNGVKAGVSHMPRPSLNPRHPVHVTMRLRRGLPSLRYKLVARVILAAFHAAKMRLGARLVHFSVQSNHLHLLVEAEGPRALSRAMQGLAVRIARRLNARLGTRGSVFADRYHARALRTPREVRHALVYVLHNHKHHANGQGRPTPIDMLSSAPYFDGFAGAEDRGVTTAAVPVASPRTWLLRVGWRLGGPIDIHDALR
jgi:REP element-mobilizing transposase RayT